jgi:hypothetical protein
LLVTRHFAHDAELAQKSVYFSYQVFHCYSSLGAVKDSLSKFTNALLPTLSWSRLN